MSSCRFSVVIPTRDREATLGFTLQTCLAQEFDDFEIVVADNSTTPATGELIKRIDSPLIRHVRPPRPLAMTDNWEFGVSQSKGEFVTVLGSDDGLLLHALPEIDRIVRKLKTKILRWDPVCYNWPDLEARGIILPHELLIPMKQKDWYHPVERRESSQMILAAARGDVSYAELPMIYCSAIHRDVIGMVRARAGRVFGSESPDVYSAFAFAHAAGPWYYSLGAPMCINGLSGGSTGVALIFLNGESPIADDFHRLYAGSSHLPPPEVPRLSVMAALVADSFMRARAALFPDDENLVLDRRVLITRALEQVRSAGEGGWQAALQAARLSLADDAGLREWFEREFGGRMRADIPLPAPQKHRRWGQTHLHLDASEFGVTNVMEAAQLVEKLLGLKRDGVNAYYKPESQA